MPLSTCFFLLLHKQTNFDEEIILRTKGTAHASGVASSGAVLGDLVSTMPSILYGLSIIGTGTRFALTKTGTHLSDIGPADTTHVSLSTLFGIFPFFDLFVI